jgi:hypothetical protein
MRLIAEPEHALNGVVALHDTEQPHSSLGYRSPLEFKRARGQVQAESGDSPIPT